MRVLVTGATGLVGQKLCRELLLKNHELVVVSRSDSESFYRRFPLPCEHHTWETLDGVQGIDAVIHLAGESVASGRWTASRKKRILNSRVQTTQKLVDLFEKKNKWPKAFITASAIGYYGSRGDEQLDENSQQGTGFLSEVCQKWEQASEAFEKHSRRTRVRIGLVFDPLGGFLAQMEPIFCNSVGGAIGSGRQYLSWIHIDDLVNMLIYSLENESVSGVINGVSPEPVTNKQMTKALAETFKVYAPFPVPGFVLKLLLGEMSQLALMSQKLSTDKIQSLGFKFKFPEIKNALKDLYAWKSSPSEHLLVQDQWLPQKKSEVFPFFAEARNLEKITPEFLNFKITNVSTPSIETGTLIDYKLKLRGIPVNWRTEILNWNPDHSFVDTQLKGPYKKWHHTHSFEDCAKGTLMQDKVVYKLPMGRLGDLVAGWYVAKDVLKIFGHRKEVIDEIFEVKK